MTKTPSPGRLLPPPSKLAGAPPPPSTPIEPPHPPAASPSCVPSAASSATLTTSRWRCPHGFSGDAHTAFPSSPSKLRDSLCTGRPPAEYIAPSQSSRATLLHPTSRASADKTQSSAANLGCLVAAVGVVFEPSRLPSTPPEHTGRMLVGLHSAPAPVCLLP